MAQKANSRQEEEFLKRFSLRKFTVPTEVLKGRSAFMNRPKNNSSNLAQKHYRIEYKELKKALKIDIPWWLRTKGLEEDTNSERLATLVEESKENQLVTRINKQQITKVYDKMTFTSRSPSLTDISYSNKNSKLTGSPRKNIKPIDDCFQKETETENCIERRLSRVLRVLNSLEYARLDSGCEKCLNNEEKVTADTVKHNNEYNNNHNNNNTNDNSKNHTKRQNSTSSPRNNFCICDLEDVDMEIESLCVCLEKLLENNCNDPCHYKDIIRRLKHIRKTLCEFIKKVASSEDNLFQEKLEKIEYFIKPGHTTCKPPNEVKNSECKYKRRENRSETGCCGKKINSDEYECAPPKEESVKEECLTDHKKKDFCSSVEPEKNNNENHKPERRTSTWGCFGKIIGSGSPSKKEPVQNECLIEHKKGEDYCGSVPKTEDICKNDTTYPCLVLKQAQAEARAAEANEAKLKSKEKKGMGICWCGKGISSDAYEVAPPKKDECLAAKQKAFCDCINKTQKNLNNKEPNYPCLDLNEAPTGQGNSFDLDACYPAANDIKMEHTHSKQGKTKQTSIDKELCNDLENCFDLQECNENQIENPTNTHGHAAGNRHLPTDKKVHSIKRKEDGRCTCARKNSIIINIKEIYSLNNSPRKPTRTNVDFKSLKYHKNIEEDCEDTRTVQQAEPAVDQQNCGTPQNDSMAPERGQVKCECEVPLKKENIQNTKILKLNPEPSIAINRRIKIEQFNDIKTEPTDCDCNSIEKLEANNNHNEHFPSMADDCEDETIIDMDENCTELAKIDHCDDRHDSVLAAQNDKAVKTQNELSEGCTPCYCNDHNRKADSSLIELEPTIRVCGRAKSKSMKHFKKENLAMSIDKGFSSKDFCYDCFGKDVPIIERDLAGELRKIIGNRKRNSVFLKFTVIKSNLYHMQMSTDNDYLGCLYATESATFEARNANGFDGYITLCVTETENTLSQIECLVDHAFMVVQQEKRNSC